MKNREGEREGWMREKGREKVGWGRERKWGRESGVREGEKSWVEEGESGGKEREKKGKKHGACKLYVQNPQGIAVNSFLFEENLQLGNRPFYDLFAVVIG